MKDHFDLFVKRFLPKPPGKYMPHQGAKECERRRRQMTLNQLATHAKPLAVNHPETISGQMTRKVFDANGSKPSP